MLSGISVWQLLILLVIVILVFGSKRIRSLGSDLGSALKGFRSAMGDEESRANSDKEQDRVVNQAEDDQSSETAQNSKPGSETDATTHRNE